jgi:hypothetical protein
MARLLPPQASIGVGLAVAAVVYTIYNKALPPIADMRVADSQNRDLAASEKAATWTAVGTVAGISLIARDPDIFIIGGLTTIALAWWHRHANMVNPATGKAVQTDRAPELVPETQAQVPQDYGYQGEAQF